MNSCLARYWAYYQLQKIKIMKHLFFALLLLAALPVIGQDGITIPESGDYEFETPRTNYLAVNYTNFNSNDADEYAFVFNTFSQPYKYFRGGSGSFGYASGAISLPDGAIITKITGYVYDNNSVDFLRLRLFESTYGASNITLATIETTGVFANSTVQEIEVSGLSVVVNNSTKSYQLRFESSDSSVSDIRLYGAKIEYTTTRVQ